MVEFVSSILFLIMSVLAVLYFYLKICVYNYWNKHRVPHETPSIPLGNIKFSFFTGKKPLGNLLWDSYKNFGAHPFHGMYLFGRPVLMINEPELIKLILVKEFDRFTDRGLFMNEEVDSTSGNLFLLPAERWKKLRGKVTPTFTPAKLRQIFPIMTNVCENLIKTCEVEPNVYNELDFLDMIRRYASDIIAHTVYGCDSSCLKNPNNDFRRLGSKGTETGRFIMFLSIFFSDLFQFIRIPLYAKEANQFFTNLFVETVNYRQKEKVLKKDFMNLLIQLIDKGLLEDDGQKPQNDSTESDSKITIVEAAAQAFVFFLAGFETTSSGVSFCLLELAMNPDIQEKLYEEIKQVAEKTGFTYDSILGMEYLDMVFLETERKYPGIVFINRICNNELLIPGSNYVIPRGMRVLISTLGVHYDPKHFPNPNKFNPTRFSKENSTNRSPYVNLAFGEGPRNCIGKRFGILQSKLAIARLVYSYRFFISPNTILPVKFTSESMVVSPQHKISLRIEPRRK